MVSLNYVVSKLICIFATGKRNNNLQRIKKTDILVNVHFSNLNTEKVHELYLYYKLRMFALHHGGSFKKYCFSHYEKYKLLPKLEKLGWVTGNNIEKYRQIVNRWEAVGVWVYMDEKFLESLSAFKGFILSSTEAYVLSRNLKMQEKTAKVYHRKDNSFEQRDWVNRHNSNFWGKVKKISLDGIDNMIGRVSIDTLEKFLKISARTISRWRKESINKYRTTYLTPDRLKSSRDQSMFYYSKKSQNFVTIDQYILSDIEVFTNKYYEGQSHIVSKRNCKRRNYLSTTPSMLTFILDISNSNTTKDGVRTGQTS